MFIEFLGIIVSNDRISNKCAYRWRLSTELLKLRIKESRDSRQTEMSQVPESADEASNALDRDRFAIREVYALETLAALRKGIDGYVRDADDLDWH